MLGSLLTSQMRYKEAENILSNPLVFHNVNVQFSLGVIYLGQGRYKEGWPLYERCWAMNKGEDFANQKFARVPKSLEDMRDKDILLYHDHGLGDSLQFVRYVSLVKQYTKKISLLVPYSLVRLFQQMDLDINVIESLEHINTEYDIGLTTLPRLFETTIGTIPNKIPYFKVPKRLIRHKIVSKKLKVGLVWAGQSRDIKELKEIDNLRSMKLSNFEVLNDIENIDWYCLQLGEPLLQISNSIFGKKLKIFLNDSSDFMDTASIISQLDLVISVDTSVCHLSAGLGIETWILNRRNICWRWLYNSSVISSPWYPKIVKLYRQISKDDWSEIMPKLKSDLIELTKNKI